MVRIRRKDDGPRKYYNHHRNIRVSEDNPEADVSERDAEYLVEEHGGFEYVDETDEEEEDEETGADDEDGAEDASNETVTVSSDSTASTADDANVDSTLIDDATVDDTAEAPAETSEDEAEAESDEEMSYEERTARAEGLANEHWQHAVSAVESGDADEYLDRLEAVDDRPSVQEAIAERRADLEE